MSAFKVGDVCEIVSQIDGGYSFVGLECTVVGGLETGRPENHHTQVTGYAVNIHGRKSAAPNGNWFIRTQDLRLKRPPSWDRWIYDTNNLDMRELNSDLMKRVKQREGQTCVFGNRVFA